MRATCVENRPLRLPEEQRGRMAEYESAYPVTIGREYLVLGMAVWVNVLYFLVQDDWDGPMFAPAAMFEIGATDIPDGWRFKLGEGIKATGEELWGRPLGAMWGYPELVDDSNHAAGLGERDVEALKIFYARLADADRLA